MDLTPPPDAPPPQLFEESSQYRHWKYTPEELRELREKVNAEGAARVRKAFAEEWSVTKGAEVGPPEVDCITSEEQLALCRFYEGKLVHYCNYLKFDRSVQATALAFYKRFYLLNTVMDYCPKLYLMTCIFLSSKVENSHMSLDLFLGKIPNPPTSDKMVELEFTLSRGIRFEYMIHHPYWPLHGFFLDIQSYLASAHPRPAHEHLFQKLQKTYDRAQHFTQLATLSDLIFTHMPSQIALGCLLAAARETDFEKELDKYLAARFHADPERLVKLRMALEEVADDVTTQGDKAVNKEVAAQIANKLRKCQNPAFDPESALHKHKAQEETREREERHAKKAKLDHERRTSLEGLFTA
ncbi:cyclin ccl1 [Spizellomyces punctatus DAOM BR117]|uniref:Cyclin ccl1 n=1 Tax=Spizellomyces punctatus (strain DAOM BR117) TaxID=645134 RepID=A0A0L0H4N9_SPIPD|nr:cyclin ccl1 [Spizellomyces punctatus DAOM BR117]KNC96162.1 cyclin ccl1 [Spizellomyces punctatus DAOM BR117]|eukprot:XP_016604202.1 cyclin ccl1 [Spizellomyces punctatus DAOM BR117]